MKKEEEEMVFMTLVAAAGSDGFKNYISITFLLAIVGLLISAVFGIFCRKKKGKRKMGRKRTIRRSSPS